MFQFWFRPDGTGVIYSGSGNVGPKWYRLSKIPSLTNHQDYMVHVGWLLKPQKSPVFFISRCPEITPFIGGVISYITPSESHLFLEIYWGYKSRISQQKKHFLFGGEFSPKKPWHHKELVRVYKHLGSFGFFSTLCCLGGFWIWDLEVLKMILVQLVH